MAAEAVPSYDGANGNGGGRDVSVLKALWGDLILGVRWLFSKHAWKLLLAVLVPAGLVMFIGYLSLAKPQFYPSYLCRLSENGAIVTLFYLSAGLALSGMVLIGEVVNLVEAQRQQRPPDNQRRIAVAGILALVFAAAIVFVMRSC